MNKAALLSFGSCQGWGGRRGGWHGSYKLVLPSFFWSTDLSALCSVFFLHARRIWKAEHFLYQSNYSYLKRLSFRGRKGHFCVCVCVVLYYLQFMPINWGPFFDHPAIYILYFAAIFSHPGPSRANWMWFSLHHASALSQTWQSMHKARRLGPGPPSSLLDMWFILPE